MSISINKYIPLLASVPLAQTPGARVELVWLIKSKSAAGTSFGNKSPAKQEVSLHLVGQLARSLNVSIKAASQLKFFMVPVLSQSNMALGGLKQQGLHLGMLAVC